MRSAAALIRSLHVVPALLVCGTLVACSSEGASLPATSTSASTVRSSSTTRQSTEPASTADGSAEALKWGKEMLDVVAANAYYADRVDFQALESELMQRASARGPRSVYTVAYEAIAELGDRHSEFLEETDLNRLDRRVNAPTPSTVSSVTALEHRIGLIDLPSVQTLMPSPAADAYIAPARDGLQRFDACGWIVDLRDNSGGSVPPMLEAVAPLLGPGTFLRYRHRAGGQYLFTIGADLHLEQTFTEPSAPTTLPASEPSTGLAASPVAVLIDAVTASAAEGVLMAFIGRPNTMTFGQPTRGVPTGNDIVRLSDGSGLLLTEGIGVDRDGHTYEGPIAPDEAVVAQHAGQDAAVVAATVWLRGQPACADSGVPG